jgi:hypothetical protein
MRFSGLYALIFGLALSSAARAAPASTQDRERARALMDAGDARFEAKQYAAALEQYRGADEIMQVPTTGIEVGRTLERLGRLLEAREVLRRVSEYPQRADEPKPFSSARQRADRLLGDIAPRIPRVTLEFSGLPQGVVPEISWDGQHLDPAKIGGYLEANPGQHRAVGVAAGFPDVTREVKLAEGQALQVVLSFSRGAQPVAPQPLATRKSDLPAPVASSTGKPTLFWVGVGVAAAGVAAGSATGVYSLSRTSSAKKQCEGNVCSPDAQHDIDSAKTFAQISNVAFAVGVAGLGLATWQFFAHRPPKQDSAAPQVSARLSPGALWLDGTF